MMEFTKPHAGNVLIRSIILMFVISCPFANGLEEVTINLNSSKYNCHPKYLSLNVDGRRISRVSRGFNISSPFIQNVAASFAPADFRFGGSSGNLATFAPKNISYTPIDEDPRVTALRNSSTWGYRFSEYDEKDWIDVNKFLADAGLDLMLQFNQFQFQPDGIHWNSSNARLLLDFSASQGIPIPSAQFGNEPSHYRKTFGIELTEAQTIQGMKDLRALLNEYPQYNNTKIYGPSNNIWMHRGNKRTYFILFQTNKGYEVVDEYDFHHYYKKGSKMTLADFINPDTMELLRQDILQAIYLTDLYTPAEHRPLFRFSETGSAYSGGAPNLSNKFVAGFLWLDKLGMALTYGFTRCFRMSFYNGNYAMVTNSFPRPDTFLSGAFKLLIEGPVFEVEKDNNSTDVRIYANCASQRRYPAGSVVVYYLNLRNEAVNISLSQFAGTKLDLFVMTPGDEVGLQSDYAAMNGVKLVMNGTTMPTYTAVTHTGNDPVITVPAHSFGFIVAVNASVPLCLKYYGL